MTGEPPMTKAPNGDLVIHIFRASWTISRSSLRPGRKSAIRDSQRWVYCLKIGQNHPKLKRNMEGDGIAFDMLCSIRYIDWWTSGHNSNSGSLSLSLSLPCLGFKQFSAQHFQTWDHQIIHSIISTIAMWKPLISQLVGYGVFVNRLMSTTPKLAKHCLPRHRVNTFFVRAGGRAGGPVAGAGGPVAVSAGAPRSSTGRAPIVRTP